MQQTLRWEIYSDSTPKRKHRVPLRIFSASYSDSKNLLYSPTAIRIIPRIIWVMAKVLKRLTNRHRTPWPYSPPASLTRPSPSIKGEPSPFTKGYLKPLPKLLTLLFSIWCLSYRVRAWELVDLITGGPSDLRNRWLERDDDPVKALQRNKSARRTQAKSEKNINWLIKCCQRSFDENLWCIKQPAWW